MDIEDVLAACPLSVGEGGDEVRDEIGREVISAARGVLDSMDRSGDAESMGVSMRSLAMLTYLRTMLSGNESLALKAAGRVLDRSDGRAISRVSVDVSGGNLRNIGGCILEDRGDIVRALEFIDERSGGELGRIVNDVIDIELVGDDAV